MQKLPLFSCILLRNEGKKPLSDAPAKTKNGTLFGDEHFAAAAVDIITAHDFGEAELFVYLALQVVHEPVEAPERYLAQYPDSDFATRRTQNAMASVMDSAVKNVTDALHARGVFDKTLIFFTADNGGNSGYSKFAGNNYPHRGGKSSDFEGGVRVSAFVSGGALPASLRGAKRTGLMHVADLHATLCGLAGAPLGGQEHGVPAISSLDMWGYLSGSVEQSPRTEVPLSTVNWHGLHFNFSLNESAAVIVGRHKLVVGSQAYLGFWQGALYPNQSTPCGTEHVHGTSAVCGAGCGTGCVFDIFADPSEHVDLAPQLPQLKADLLARLQRMRQERFQTDGDNSRLNFSSIGWTKPIATRAKDSEARGDFWGPYSISDMAV